MHSPVANKTRCILRPVNEWKRRKIHHHFHAVSMILCSINGYVHLKEKKRQFHFAPTNQRGGLNWDRLDWGFPFFSIYSLIFVGFQSTKRLGETLAAYSRNLHTSPPPFFIIWWGWDKQKRIAGPIDAMWYWPGVLLCCMCVQWISLSLCLLTHRRLLGLSGKTLDALAAY